MNMREALAKTAEKRAELHPEVARVIRTGMTSPAQISEIAAAPHRADPDAPVMPADGEPDCAACGNKRFIVGADDKLKPCGKCGVAAKRAAVALDAFSSANGRATAQTFRTFRADWEGSMNPTLALAKVAAQEFAAAPDGFLVMWGSTGNGKSHLCAAICNALRDRNQPVIFVRLDKLVDSVKRLYNEDEAKAAGLSSSQMLDKYCKAETLLIDDIGAGNYTTHDDGILSTLVDHRYTNQLPTVFVSNLDVRTKDDHGNVNTRFDPRIVSRWNDVQFSQVLRTASADYRQRERDDLSF